MTATAYLSVTDVSVRFGGVHALRGVSLTIDRGEIVGLIGPNGAGKTTLFNAITGLIRPTSGDIVFAGKSIVRLPMERIAREGLVRTFQQTELFDELSVVDNVRVALHAAQPQGRGEQRVYLSKADVEAAQTRAVQDLLGDLGLEHVATTTAGELDHGHRKLVGIAVALATAPSCLLLDEPVAGMNAREVARCLSLIETLRSRGLAVLLVEHNVRAVMQVTDRIVVLNFGSVIAVGSPSDVQADDAVREAYLGADTDGSADV